MDSLIQFVSTTFQNVRSSKRTDKLHSAVLDYLYYVNPSLARFDVCYEYTVDDAFGGTFTVDIALMEDGKLHTAVLCKSINSNINKNIKNSANTTIGEAARLCYSPLPPEKVVFVTVLPEVAPVFTKDGTVRCFDDVIKAKTRTNINRVLTQQYGTRVTTLDLWYQIPDVESRTDQHAYDEFTPIVSW